MPLPVVYRITPFDPTGCVASEWSGAVDVATPDGSLESAYLDSVEAFARELGVTHLEVRDPEVYDSPDDVAYGPGDTLAQVFGPGLVGLFDGAVVDIAATRLLVGTMLRRGDKSLWCRLEAPAMRVDVGYDLDIDVETSCECPDAARTTRASGLSPERLYPAPHVSEEEAERDSWASMHTPIDDAFWERVDALVRERGAVVLEESAGWIRWHRLTPSTPRPTLRPRCLVWVWPDLTTDRAAVMSHLQADDPDDVQGTIVWQATDDRLRHASLTPENVEDVRAHLAKATRALWHSDYVDELYPLIEAVQPDEDGLIRARREPLALQRTSTP